ncbi:hypothetical protein A3J19_04305 [Candidatus Daviesbacteria bacterium RIFCSPLOWO2_02_FULL_41_8]|uniref:Uncharacterized protein n=3 Tax=Candidatus Daviesiibacteriota TaxID=1752718 RepID=A0A1F5NJN4_9BACT|nr:MAG: hypothetical protein A2871_00425 [Candidatus Daviesbacteria bacterium RIFCSPHIGHO2_01_FULL_41_23]OGE32863.1 MAG: hypothetical protein A3D83_01720 [Candidatus Daviesbacteria bacterium RIFCSPHIGHO2_02_FULL_41_10]OGE62362.1 MAG: hypothetical protein A2967_00915 [Candidatus Daviesbacteria bacterium RIFCSPLOWO2_01_FULL_41_32]OGE77712.1 MAG: hypothetical protein A3J19_04305 [Candidatus Daviesbacteria bacterium RIFCSPLOWO2_02_FULL_41_8]
MLPKIIIGVLVVICIFVIGLFIIGNLNPDPQCPNPLIFQTPIDITKATSLLYPGQIRGGDFKPHGGFRFDNSKNDEIEVRIPIDSKFVSASRYLEQGEVQYLFDFELPCGIMYRFDHLLTLTPKFAEIVKDLPKPKENDSRTSGLKQKVNLTKGEIIATGVGIRRNQNVFVDFGVYDMRGKMFQGPRQNGICWFNLLSKEDEAKIKRLPPADSQSGSQSTLCKP